MFSRRAFGPETQTLSRSQSWTKSASTWARHQPQSIEDLEDTTFDLIVTLAPEAHHKALEFTRTMAVDVEYWPTLEPSATAGNREQILQSYRDVRDQLFERIKARFGLAGTPQA